MCRLSSSVLGRAKRMPEVFGLVVGVTLRAAEHEEIALFARFRFGANDDLGEEIVAEIGGDQAQRMRPLGDQAASNGAGLIA